MTFTVDASSLAPTLANIAVVILAALGSWLASTLRTKYKLSSAADVLDQVLTAGVGFAQGKLTQLAGTTDLLKFDTHSQAVSAVANFALQNAPSALKALGITETGVEQWALSKLAVQAPDLIYVPGVSAPNAPTAVTPVVPVAQAPALAPALPAAPAASLAPAGT
jgi:hypothetical protein